MEKKLELRYLFGKLIVYIILGVLVFVFREHHINNLRFFIGFLIILYGLDGFVFSILFSRKNILHESKTYLAGVELLFGIILVSVPVAFEYVCVLWATWSIVRESYEIKEIVTELKAVTPKILSGIESIVVIVLSVMLICDPGEHHAMTHLYLLIIELVLSPFIPLLDNSITFYKNQKKENDTKGE